MQGGYVQITPISNIPEYTADPPFNYPGQAWVLRTGMPAGSPIGLLLALTYAGFTYQLSYYTTEGTIVRVKLS